MNTREAMQAVAHMFNNTLNIGRDMGWATTHAVDELEEEFADKGG
jgi:hypothetical protein